MSLKFLASFLMRFSIHVPVKSCSVLSRQITLKTLILWKEKVCPRLRWKTLKRIDCQWYMMDGEDTPKAYISDLDSNMTAIYINVIAFCVMWQEGFQTFWDCYRTFVHLKSKNYRTFVNLEAHTLLVKHIILLLYVTAFSIGLEL